MESDENSRMNENYIENPNEIDQSSALKVTELSDIPNKHHNLGQETRLMEEIPKLIPEKDSKKSEKDDEKELEKSPDKRFIKYDKEVGRGSFKTVYKSLDSSTGSTVAWLELQPHKLTKEDRSRFKVEAAILKKLQHPNIVRFYDSWESTSGEKKLKTIVLITELMTSGTLKHYLKKFKVIRSKPLKSWSRQILLGLQYLHSRDPPILHRDLKCDNIFVTGQTGVVKIGDLGLATIKRHGGNAKSVIGTPEFMAPEMYEENYAEPADVYAFGMCLLEMVTNEYPYEECYNASLIFKKVSNGELPNAFKKVEDDKIKSIIQSCIVRAPSDRVTVQQLLENDFFEDKYLNVLVVGKTGNELKLRLVVNEIATNSVRTDRRMPEDEAIDFTFRYGTDSALQVAKDMASESTLNVVDIPLVSRAIQTAVTNHMKKVNIITIVDKDKENKPKKDDKIQTDLTNKTPTGSNLKTSTSQNELKDLKVQEIEIVPSALVETKTSNEENKTITTDANPTKEVEIANKTDDIAQPEKTATAQIEGNPEVVPLQPSNSSQPIQPSNSTQAVPTTKQTKPMEEKTKRDKKKGNSKKGMSITVTSIKNMEIVEGKAMAWEVQVRITAADITIISFKVERSKTVDETVKQLSNEIIKSALIPEVLREKAEKLLVGLITRMYENNFDDSEKSYPTQVIWNGCRRLEDGNMEIEVTVNSVRHVPPLTIKYTKGKMEQQIRSIKDQGIILEHEVPSTAKKFKEQYDKSVEKFTTDTTKSEKFGEMTPNPDNADQPFPPTVKGPIHIPLPDVSQKVEMTPSDHDKSPAVSPNQTTVDKPEKNELKADIIPAKEIRTKIESEPERTGRFSIQKAPVEQPTKEPTEIISRFKINPVTIKPVVDEKHTTHTQTNTQIQDDTSIEKEKTTEKDTTKIQPEQLENDFGTRIKETLKETLETVANDKDSHGTNLLQGNQFVREEIRRSSPDDSPYVSSMSASESRGVPDRTNVNIRAIENLSTEMRKLRCQLKEQNELLIRTLTVTNDQTMKLFDAWEKTIDKMYSKNRRNLQNGRRLGPSHSRTRRDRGNLNKSDRGDESDDESADPNPTKAKPTSHFLPKQENHEEVRVTPPAQVHDQRSHQAFAQNPKVVQSSTRFNQGYGEAYPTDSNPALQQHKAQYVNPAGSISSEPAFNQAQAPPPNNSVQNMYTQSVYSTGNSQLQGQVQMPQRVPMANSNPLSHLIPYNTQMGMLNGYGEDAFSLAIQLLKLGTQQQHLQQQPLNLQQNMMRNFQIQQPHQSQQQPQQQVEPAVMAPSGNQQSYQQYTPAPSLIGGQTNEQKTTNQVSANQPNPQSQHPSNSNMSINQRQANTETVTLERDDPQIRTQNWVESHNPRNQQDQINIMTDSMNQKDQINRAQYESNLAMQQQQQQQQQPPQASAPTALQQQGQAGQQGETRRASNVYGTQQNEQMITNPYNPQIIQNQSFNQTQQSIPNIQQQTGINQHNFNQVIQQQQKQQQQRQQPTSHPPPSGSQQQFSQQQIQNQITHQMQQSQQQVQQTPQMTSQMASHVQPHQQMNMPHYTVNPQSDVDQKFS